MTTEQIKFNELSQSFAGLNDKFKEIIAKSKSDTSEPNAPTTQDCMNAMQACFANLHQRVSSLADDMYGYQSNHQKGHLPPINSPGQMNKVLAALGMDEDYAAQKKPIFASKDLFTIKTK